jgi:hypothetical protein
MGDDDTFHAITEAEFPQTCLDVPADDLIASAQVTVSGRADCCLARAAVRVVMPTSEGTPRIQLLLCAHHYRAVHARLAQAGTSVFDSANRLISSPHDAAQPVACLWPPV